MPRKGRPPAPAAVQVLRGERPSRINKYPAVPLDEPPVCPHWLIGEDDRAEFERVAALTYRAGLTKSLDSNLLGRYVRAMAVWRQADALVVADGVLIEDRDGDTRRNPALIAARQYAHEARLLEVELGLTPSARSTIRAAQPRTVDPAARLLTSGSLPN
jgi:P27 family predicted phage terminase small subunit